MDQDGASRDCVDNIDARTQHRPAPPDRTESAIHGREEFRLLLVPEPVADLLDGGHVVSRVARPIVVCANALCDDVRIDCVTDHTRDYSV